MDREPIPRPPWQRGHQPQQKTAPVQAGSRADRTQLVRWFSLMAFPILLDFPEGFIRRQGLPNMVNNTLVGIRIKFGPPLISEFSPLLLESAKVFFRQCFQQHLVNRRMQALHALMLVESGTDKTSLEIAVDYLSSHAMCHTDAMRAGGGDGVLAPLFVCLVEVIGMRKAS